MNRVLKCVRYQRVRTARFAVIFTLIYIASFILMLAVSSIAYRQNQLTGTINANYGFVAIFLAFIGISTMYKGFFNNLLIFGNTRETILTSYFTFSALLSAVLAVLSEISELINSCINQILPFVKTSGLNELYPNINPAQELLWVFTLILLFTMAGYVYGAFCYKFGKVFRIVFWCCIGLLFMFIPSIATPALFPATLNAVKAFFGYELANGVYLCSLHFFIISVALGVILWFIAIKQPQNA